MSETSFGRNSDADPSKPGILSPDALKDLGRTGTSVITVELVPGADTPHGGAHGRMASKVDSVAQTLAGDADPANGLVIDFTPGIPKPPSEEARQGQPPHPQAT